MFHILKKLLSSEGGWISGAMMLGSMIGQGVMGSQKSKQATKLAHKTGEEQNWQNFLADTVGPMREHAYGLQQSDQGLLTGIRENANAGLMSAIPEVFSQRPNSSQLDAIASQQKMLENKALNTGTRGGLLKQQMFEAAKNAAQNKLAVSENARQNALQRAFGIVQPAMPTQQTDIARGNQVLGYNQLENSGLGQLAQLGVQRNMAQMGNVSKDAAGMGSGLGSILGGLDFSSIMNMFGGGGAVTNAVGGTPAFSMPVGGQGFASVPFMAG